jgi:fatty aldehyde decarbonylase
MQLVQSGPLTQDNPRFSQVYRTILSHIVTGESVGVEHYARMIPLSRTIQERIDLVDAAHEERCHLASIMDVAKALGIAPEWAAQDSYWGPVRQTFREAADAGDILACYVMQDVVLESFAVTLYGAIQPGLEAAVAARVAVIAADEHEHLRHGVTNLRSVYGNDGAAVELRVELSNERVARVLAEWVRVEDCTPVCGVCHMTRGSCFKDDLKLIDVNLEQTRAQFISLYGESLREIGFASSAVTRWLARMPS